MWCWNCHYGSATTLFRARRATDGEIALGEKPVARCPQCGSEVSNREVFDKVTRRLEKPFRAFKDTPFSKDSVRVGGRKVGPSHTGRGNE
jgi:hypothetical protein